MDNVYGVRKSRYDDSPFVVVDKRSDAILIAKNLKGYDDDKPDSLVVTLPFLRSTPQKVDFKDVDRLVNLSMEAAFRAVEEAGVRFAKEDGANG